MKETVESRIRALTKKAREGRKIVKASALPNRSSLHKVIRTKEQANAFMKLLKLA